LLKRKTCNVEIISIGNELLLGNTINTNASWLAKRVTAEGGLVRRITVVEDNLQQISAIINEALRRRSNFIITTGGIGPTFDDMTVKAIARAIHRRLWLDPEALRMIKDHYAKRFPNKRLKLTRERLKMAMLPTNASALPNPVGTAPAVRMKIRRMEIFCLPGVPREMKAIFNASVADQIHNEAGGRKFIERWIKVTGIMESNMAPAVEQTMKRWPNVYIKSHPRGFHRQRPTIEIHLSSLSSTPEEARMELSAATKHLLLKLRTLKGRVNTE
jgi:molybdenum cofactor synthesis domain-containing protein